MEPSLHWLLLGKETEEREASISLQPWEWSKETPSSPWVRCVQSVCTGADNCMLIISQVLKGSRKELFPLPSSSLGPWDSRHGEAVLFTGIFQYYLLQTEQKLCRGLKKTKKAPQNDEENNIDKALCIRLHYK